MPLQIAGLSFTASAIDTFVDCPARFYHQEQRYPATELLTTDRTAAAVASAIHDAAMRLHRQVEHAVRYGKSPSPTEVHDRLRVLLLQAPDEQRLDPTRPSVRERLKKLEPAFAPLAELVLADMPLWARDPANQAPLVWVEQALDHGPAVRAVQLADGYLARTKPDLIGLRMVGSDRCRPLVRDYKARGALVDPAFDIGILVRAAWVYRELREPRCRWFLLERSIDVERGAIDLETVNLLHAGTDDFVVRATLTEEALLARLERLTETMREMGTTLELDGPEDVPANPGPFCQTWCPYLHRCTAGRDYVEKYAGAGTLAERLGT